MARTRGREDWIGLFYHDADEAFGRIAQVGGRYEFHPLADVETP